MLMIKSMCFYKFGTVAELPLFFNVKTDPRPQTKNLTIFYWLRYNTRSCFRDSLTSGVIQNRQISTLERCREKNISTQ